MLYKQTRVLQTYGHGLEADNLCSVYIYKPHTELPTVIFQISVSLFSVSPILSSLLHQHLPAHSVILYLQWEEDSYENKRQMLTTTMHFMHA